MVSPSQGGLLLALLSTTSAFTATPKIPATGLVLKRTSGWTVRPGRRRQDFPTILFQTSDLEDPKGTHEPTTEAEFDEILSEANLPKAIRFFQSNPKTDLTRDRWNRIFDTIEEVTAQAEANAINTRQEQEFPLLSRSRMEMSDMYTTLKDRGHLKLFGAIDKNNMPASGSKSIRPSMLEEITLLSMKSLTPNPSNTLLYAGIALAVIEGIASAVWDIDLNFLFLTTLAAAAFDKILLNGALSESALKILSPSTQPKITRHEAGHFLCAYLLGCPVEGYVLSAWAALQDARFGSRAVSAGTSFFYPILSSQIQKSKVTRSSIDRYSIIVMAGIAAEAVNYGQADGGAGDEMALISFLTNLNGGPNPAWNDVTIRNQARWGALQAVLMIREYKDCYEALVDALERGGSLGDCIYAIEKAGRESGKLPLQKPLGYILERPNGMEEDWVTELPEEVARAREEFEQKQVVTAAIAPTPAPLDPAESLKTLQGYKEELKARLEEIESKLDDL